LPPIRTPIASRTTTTVRRGSRVGTSSSGARENAAGTVPVSDTRSSSRTVVGRRKQSGEVTDRSAHNVAYFRAAAATSFPGRRPLTLVRRRRFSRTARVVRRPNGSCPFGVADGPRETDADRRPKRDCGARQRTPRTWTRTAGPDCARDVVRKPIIYSNPSVKKA